MKHYLFAITILLCTCSCSNNMYFPDRVCVAGLTEKGEWKAHASVKLHGLNASDDIVSLSADGVYAIANNLYCMASYRNILNRELRTSEFWTGNNTTAKYNGHRAEVALGTWTPLARGSQLELAGGYGSGMLSREYLGEQNLFFPYSALDKSSYKTTYHRMFVQLGFTRRVNLTHIAMGARYSRQFGYSFDQSLHSQLQGQVTTGSFDPFVDAEIGRKLLFNLQFGFSFFAVTQSIHNLDAKPYLCLGLSYHHMRGKRPTTTGDNDPR